MMRVYIAMILACAAFACTDTKRSTLPPFVRELRAGYGGIEMIQCQIIATTTRKNHMGYGGETERELSIGQCWTQVVSTEPPAGEGQPGMQPPAVPVQPAPPVMPVPTLPAPGGPR